MSGDNVVYSKGGYKILSVGSDYIAVNSEKGAFKEAHTHLKNFKQAMYVINMVSHKRVPRHLSDYLLVSLIRISNDESYREMIEELLNRRAQKRRGNRGYCNSSCYC